MSDHKYFRILSLDGGGIRGLIPAQILTVLENKLKQATNDPGTRIGEWFDLIAGTSTGGILTCVYLCPAKDNPARPRYAASDAVELYRKNGALIFNVPLGHKIKSAEGVLDEKYSATGLESLLLEKLEDLTVADLLKPCLITAYDIENRAAHFFTQHDAKKHPGENFFLRDAARATSAAPTYFECARIESQSHVPYSLIDGGIFANNPALCAFAEVRKIDSKISTKDILVLSLGTGEVKTPYYYEQVKNWGDLGWVKPIVDILMSGTVEVADYQLRKTYEAINAPDQYLRIQPEIDPKNSDLGNVTPENLYELVAIGQKAAEKNEAVLDKFVAMLRATKE